MAVLDAFPANSENPNIKFSRESMPQDPSKRFDQDIVFSPLSWLLPCVGALRASGFSLLHRFSPQFRVIGKGIDLNFIQEP